MIARCFTTALAAGFLLASAVSGQTKSVELAVTGGDVDQSNVPVCVALQLPAELADATAVRITDASGNTMAGQLAPPSLLAEAAPGGDRTVSRELHFVLPEIKAGQSARLSAVIDGGRPDPSKGFAFADEPGKFIELKFDGRPVLRYMHEAIDESTKERRMETYKVYHHVYNPAGTRFVTKGAGGLFPHHRGLFFGFNRISYGDGQGADVWHCNRGESQSHEKVLAAQTGPVLGRHSLAVDWHGRDGKVFVHEERELTALNVSGGTLVEFASRLTSAVGRVKLDGDPQHAGFQFRGSQDIPDKTKNLTYYLRPDGKDKPGSFRNWPANKQHADLPWNAQSFVLDDVRYTCCYLDRPENPKEARFSERDYGRFGSYFEFEVDENRPLEVNYRIWLQEGEMTVEGVTAHSTNFVAPPEVTVEP